MFQSSAVELLARQMFTPQNTSKQHLPLENLTFLDLVFDKTLKVGHSAFSIDGQTFLTRLGGSVSSGRTLLWILVSLLGVSQVKFSIQFLQFSVKVIQRIKNFIL